jgi:hypothetical protein
MPCGTSISTYFDELNSFCDLEVEIEGPHGLKPVVSRKGVGEFILG